MMAVFSTLFYFYLLFYSAQTWSGGTLSSGPFHQKNLRKSFAQKFVHKVSKPAQKNPLLWKEAEMAVDIDEKPVNKPGVSLWINIHLTELLPQIFTPLYSPSDLRTRINRPTQYKFSRLRTTPQVIDSLSMLKRVVWT